jgi:histidine ammonia-lyase
VSAIVVTGDGGIGVEHVADVARRSARVTVTAEAMQRVGKAREVLDRVAASGQQIYGLNTGLGANLRTAITGDAAAFQHQLLAGRSAAVGEPLPTELVRAIMFARVVMLAPGGSGISPHVLDALLAALNAGVHPVMPSLGSIGAGDLVLMAALARALTGAGEAEVQGGRMPAAQALAAAGLKPTELAPKDGLSLINASAVSVGHGALAVFDALSAFRQAQQAAALSMAGFGANRSILDPRLTAARPAAGQVTAANELRALLGEETGQPPSLQDPLSIRCLPSIHGALLAALHNTRVAVEIELNSASDNPLVLTEEGAVMSSGNFHTAALSLTFETLGLAIAQAAAASAARFIQLTGSGRNSLPKYLSPAGGASAGFVPLQKTVAAILVTIRHKANPAMLDFLPVSEGVEDHAAQTPVVVAKCAEIVELWRRLAAFELLAASQAVDLRDDAHLAPAMAGIHAAIRAIVAPLDQDRPLGPDAEALYAALSSGKWQA